MGRLDWVQGWREERRRRELGLGFFIREAEVLPLLGLGRSAVGGAVLICV